MYETLTLLLNLRCRRAACGCWGRKAASRAASKAASKATCDVRAQHAAVGVVNGSVEARERLAARWRPLAVKVVNGSVEAREHLAARWRLVERDPRRVAGYHVEGAVWKHVRLLRHITGITARITARITERSMRRFDCGTYSRL